MIPLTADMADDHNASAPITAPPESVTHDATLAIDQFGTWVRNADTKAALLATAVTILGNSEIGQRAIATQRFPLDSPEDWVAIALYCGAISLLLLSIIFLTIVLRPRRIIRTFTRFSWPTVAELTEAELLNAVSQPNANREAWITAHTLARIADFKLRYFSWALSAAVASAFLFIVALALA